jgi:glycosyltransferase involved in cell wall biosynthesis
MKVGILSYHRAPYRDPVFTEVQRRGNIDLRVLTMFATDANHPYRHESEGGYPNTPLKKGYKMLGVSWLHPGIVPALLHGKFDVVVVSGYYNVTSILAMLLCWVKGTPFIYSGDTIKSVNYQPRMKLLSAILKQAAAAWVPGAASRALLEKCGMAANYIYEGAYCLDFTYLRGVLDQRRSTRTALRRSLSISDEDFVFLFVGRMIPARGLKYLINAFAKVCDSEAHTFLVLVGNGPVRDEMERLAHLQGLSRVRVVAPMDFDKLCDYYAAADAYVMPAVAEPYSLALAEAAIAGLPIITTDAVGAAADYVRPETGFVVPTGDIVALCNAMCALVRDKSMAHTMGSLGRNLASRRSVEWAATQLEQAIITAVSRRDSSVVRYK